jgi:phage terminase small subunit
MRDELTPMQERFMTESLVDLHQRNAAYRAGYSPDSADTIASQVMKLPQVQAEIARRTAAFAARAAVSKEHVLATLQAIAFADYTQAFTVDWRLASPQDLPEDLRLCIHEIIPLKDGTVRAKFADRTRALELLARHLGLLEAAEQGPGFTLVINQADHLHDRVDGPTDTVEMGGFAVNIPRDA